MIHYLIIFFLVIVIVIQICYLSVIGRYWSGWRKLLRVSRNCQTSNTRYSSVYSVSIFFLFFFSIFFLFFFLLVSVFVKVNFEYTALTGALYVVVNMSVRLSICQS